MEADESRFTFRDREELMRQGFEINKFHTDIDDVKVLLNETLNKLDPERRIRKLEDWCLIQETRLNTLFIISTIIGSAFATVIEFALHFFKKG